MIISIQLRLYLSVPEVMLPFIQTKKFPFSTRVYGRRVYVMDSEDPNAGILQLCSPQGTVLTDG